METYFISYPIPTLDAQFLFQAKIDGNSLIQLKDGKLLLFYFQEFYLINIYNEKTFQKIFEIDFYESISEYEKEQLNKYNKNKNSIKELSNGLILIGRNNYLIELNIKRKEYNLKVIKKLDNTILDINELSDTRMIAITTEKIIILKKENEEYIIKEEYLIKKNWKMKCYSLEDKSYEKFQQYYAAYELPNNRLLLNSFSFEKQNIERGCVRMFPIKHLNSKIIIIDLNNFEEIKSTKTFDSYVNYTILKNVIIIQSPKHIYIYDINSLELIQDGLYSSGYGMIYKFNNEYVISFRSYYNDNKSLIISKMKDNRLVQCYEIKIDSLKKLYFWEYDEYMKYGKYILISMDRRIIIHYHQKIIILRLDKDL